MKKKYILFVMVSLTTAFSGVARGFDSIYHYDTMEQILPRDYYRKPIRAFTFDFKHGVITGNRNQQAALLACKKQKKYFCITSEIFTFAVPYKGLKIGKKWKIAGQRFQVLTKIDIEILGKRYHVYLIDMVLNKKLKHQFLYSKDKGLISFLISKIGHYRGYTYFLRENSGLGANVHKSE